MLLSFFAQAAQSPTQQRSLRRAVLAHVLLIAALLGSLIVAPTDSSRLMLGYLMLVAGIVEGAILIGWRLTQIPKSQALEFLLVSPLRARWVLIDEVIVGITRLTLVTLSGLPLFALMAGLGLVYPADLLLFMILPLIWGTLTGLLLTVCAYEPTWLRRLGERFLLLLVLVYLVVGVLAGEKLKLWLLELPNSIGRRIYYGLIGFREYNPFGVVKYWMTEGPSVAWDRFFYVELFGLGVIVLFILRASSRLQAHFHERHYSPITARRKDQSDKIQNQPLRWWAVRRVSQYSGSINLWLAGGFCLLYAFYLIAGVHWPNWMGRSIFVTCDRRLGPEGLATILIILAAVPAAYQYGLWDPSAQDRCKRLELLLLTKLEGRDFWNAAAAAAWHRGQGYFVFAAMLWMAAFGAGRLTIVELLAAFAVSVLLWSFYFALGFRAFSRGHQANGLGMLLTVAIPLICAMLYRLQWSQLATLLPPGALYGASQASSGLWIVSALLMGALAVIITKQAIRTCVADLQRWYDLNHGQKAIV